MKFRITISISIGLAFVLTTVISTGPITQEAYAAVGSSSSTASGGSEVCCGVPLSLIGVDSSAHVLSVEALFCVVDKSEDDVCAKDFGKLTNDIYDRTRLKQMMAMTHMVFGIF